MDETKPILIQDAEQRVHVSSLAGALRSSHSQLQLDSCNGLHKFFWVSRGNGRCMVNGVTRAFGPNTVIFIRHDAPHQFKLSSNVFGILVSLEPNVAVALPNQNLFLPILNLIDQKQIANSFDQVNTEFNNSNIGRNLSVEYQSGLLAIKVARMAQKYFKVNKSTAAQRLMERFVHILEKKYRTGHTLADYAKELGVTATHLTRVCQRVNGKSTSRFTQERVLAEAWMMLSNTDYKILEISNILGFSSAAFYTRLFSAKQGQTPKEFRRSA